MIIFPITGNRHIYQSDKERNVMRKMKWDLSSLLMSVLISAALLIIVLSIGSAIAYCVNYHYNVHTQKNAGYFFVSELRGIAGHVELAAYTGGGYEVKIYPSLGQQISSSVSYDDLNGDKKVDRIRINNSGLKAYSLDQLLVRRYDYEEHKKEFDEADKVLGDLIKKYPLPSALGGR